MTFIKLIIQTLIKKSKFKDQYLSPKLIRKKLYPSCVKVNYDEKIRGRRH